MAWVPDDDAVIYRKCRALGHAWDNLPTTPQHLRGRYVSVGCILVVSRCTRCTSQKLEDMDQLTGDIVRRQYRYAPGYLHKGSSGYRRADWRLSYLRGTAVIGKQRRTR